MSQTAAQKRQDELAALAAKLNPVQTNYTPSKGLDAIIFFDNGTSLDTNSNIMTMSNGKQIDTTTGLEYHDPKDYHQHGERRLPGHQEQHSAPCPMALRSTASPA